MRKLFSKLKFCLVLPFLCLWLTSCIVVGDIGEYWEKGIIDPSLEGAWVDASDYCLMFAADGKNYHIIEKEKKERGLSRTLDLGNSKFLMVKENKEDKKAILIRYTVSGDELIIYNPNGDKRAEFFDKYPNSNIKFDDGEHVSIINIPRLSFPVLDGTYIALLEDVSNNPDYWKSDVYNRVKKKCKRQDAE